MNSFNKKPFSSPRLTALAAGLVLFAAVFFARDIKNVSAAVAKAGYDAFTREMAYVPNNSAVKKIAANFLTYPFEIVRWPLNKTLTFLEEKNIVAKTQYVFEELDKHGINPRLNFSAWGSDFDLPKLLGIDHKVPTNLIAKSWIVYGRENIFETGAKIGALPVGDSGFHGFGNFKYDRRPEEDFYGLGPNSSEGDETSYKMETTAVEGVTGYTLNSFLNFDLKAGYKNVNISAAKDDDDPIILEKNFSDRPVNGLYGDQLLNVGTEISWDPTPEEDLGATPGKVRLAADFNEGVDNDARYFKFLADIGKNFEVGSPLRILALHFYGEHNNELPGHNVPFHEMARLGGFGNYPNISRALRSYDVDRFYDNNAALFNVEYRYRIYEYRNWSVSHVFFLDQGQVFKSFGKFKPNDFRESYGTGLRLYLLHRVFFDVEVAHGDEGTAFHFRNSQPF